MSGGIAECVHKSPSAAYSLVLITIPSLITDSKRLNDKPQNSAFSWSDNYPSPTFTWHHPILRNCNSLTLDRYPSYVLSIVWFEILSETLPLALKYVLINRLLQFLLWIAPSEITLPLKKKNNHFLYFSIQFMGPGGMPSFSLLFPDQLNKFTRKSHGQPLPTLTVSEAAHITLISLRLYDDNPPVMSKKPFLQANSKT